MTSASLSPRVAPPTIGSPPPLARADDYPLADLPALLSHSEDIVSQLQFAEDDTADDAHFEDNERVDKIERECASLVRQLERANETLERKEQQLEAKRATLMRENKKLHEALVEERRKQQALREIKEGRKAKDEEKPAPPRPPRRRGSKSKAN